MVESIDGSSGPFKPEKVVYSTPVAVREKLSMLGVPEELLIESLQRGVAEKQTAEIFDPLTAGGYDLYRYTTRYVRKGMFECGWEMSDDNNIALVRNRTDGTTIIVCSGDSQTGQLIGDDPKTKRQKGEVFLEISEFVSINLFGEREFRTRSVAQPDSNVWLLLHYHAIDNDRHILRAELSRPFEEKGGSITGWSERIILYVPLPDGRTDDESANDEGPAITPEVTIRI